LHTYVFFAWPGLPAEFSFETPADGIIEAPQARIESANRHVIVDRIAPGRQIAIRVRKPGGQETRIILLSREMAGDAWKVNLAGRERLLLSAAELYFTPNGVHLSTTDPHQLKFEILPKPAGTPAGFTSSNAHGLFEQYRTHVKPEKSKPR